MRRRIDEEKEADEIYETVREVLQSKNPTRLANRYLIKDYPQYIAEYQFLESQFSVYEACSVPEQTITGIKEKVMEKYGTELRKFGLPSLLSRTKIWYSDGTYTEVL